MEKLSEKLLIGDYFQYFNYPIRKQIVQLLKKGNMVALEGLLNGMISEERGKCELDGIQVITLLDEQYPRLLLESYDPPLVLYCKGDINLLQKTKKIAIVGSRKPKNDSLLATHKIITQLKEENDESIVIVSGLANGIDGYSHQLALDYKVATIAILGFGFNYFYPNENKALFAQIEKEGLVISEYPPHISVNRWQFVARNRIISGLCKVVIIVEAKAKSGSLITAELALSENREVFIVGGNSFDTSYYGSNSLIQEGAKLLLSVEEVLDEYKYDISPEESKEVKET